MGETLFGETDQIDELIGLLHKQPGWPADPTKDRQLVTLLLEQYPEINLSDEITKWRGWMLGHESRKKVNHRARFTTWCSRAASDRGRRGSRTQPGRPAGAGHPAATTRAGGRPGDWSGVAAGRGSW